jgi:GntR family transcriptional regulator
MSTSTDIGPGVDLTSSTPLYVQLEGLLLAQIEAGRWPAGGRIPTEAELCALYGVSRVTVRQALELLVRRGLLTRGRGRGTFVRDARLTVNARSVSSFSHELGQLGMEPGAHLLHAGVVRAEGEHAEALQIAEGTELVEFRRLRTADGLPIAVQTSLLVSDRFPGLLGRLGENASLYGVLRSAYGLVPTEAHEVFRAVGLPRRLAPVLEAPVGSHAFLATRVTLDSRGPFEHTTSVIRGDRYEIRLALRNP